MEIMTVEDLQRDIVDYVQYLKQQFGIDAARIDFSSSVGVDGVDTHIIIQRSAFVH